MPSKGDMYKSYIFRCVDKHSSYFLYLLVFIDQFSSLQLSPLLMETSSQSKAVFLLPSTQWSASNTFSQDHYRLSSTRRENT